MSDKMAAVVPPAWSSVCRLCRQFARLETFGTRGNVLYRTASTLVRRDQQKIWTANSKYFQRLPLSSSAVNRSSSSLAKQPIQNDIKLSEGKGLAESNENLVEKVKNAAVNDQMFRRIFAVVYFGGRQFKIATNDIIMVHKIAAQCGDKIRLQKVLMLGGREFSLMGKPLLSPDQVKIEATVLEKTRGRKLIVFKKKRRKNYKLWRGHRQDLTVLRINRISLDPEMIDVSTRDQV